eukprot:11999277-Karenia_brevis.AAC.1
MCCFEVAKCACPVVEACRCISDDESCATWTKYTCKRWDLRKQFNTDLLPRVQVGLIQDGPDSVPLEADKTSEAMQELH